jgi:uncharacterized protein YndB with AHSA1/START domain
MNDVIERELVLSQPVERVWRALTDPKELGTWFPDRCELDVRPGGTGTFSFDMDGGAEHVADVIVEAVDPMTRFAFRWGNAATPDDPKTLVEFTLEPMDVGTRLRLVESGFAKMADGDQQRAGNEEGWTIQLKCLEEHLVA